MQKINREDIIISSEIIRRLNYKSFVGQNYLDIDCFNELIATTFDLKRVHLHPTRRVGPLIGEYKVKINGMTLYVYLQEEWIGYLSVGMCIGWQGTWLNPNIRNIIRGTGN